ncbi:MAG TPA: DNRLRE domain-containing protein [Tepidisphaeraceae bacterium]
MNRREASERLRRAAKVVVETLEGRQLLSTNPAATPSSSLLAFNATATGYSGSGASPVQVLTITNTGGSTLNFSPGGITVVNDPSVGTSDAGDFTITNVASVPASLQPGQSANLDLDFAAQSPGLHSAFLQIASNDPANPVEKIALRGLGTTGTGGGNEPSLAAILREYEIPTIVGDGPNDANAFASTYYPASPDASSQEAAMPRLVKAGTGPVTVQLLASFDVANQPALRFGTYVPGDPNDKTELFTINQSDAQTVNPTAQGATSFDPGSGEFGLYTVFPVFTTNGQPRVSYSEDAINTWDANVPRKVRFFPFENPDGSVVPNAYVFAVEDNNIPFGNIQPYDSNDLVGIIRNVKAAPGAPNGAVLGLTNLDGVPSSTRLVFNRIQNPSPNDPAGFHDAVHDTDTLQINNTGNQTLVISSLSLSDTTDWQIVNPPTLPLSIAPGGSANITVKFVATTNPPHTDNQTNDTQTTNGLSPVQAGGVWNGTLTIASNDAARPTRTVQLAGYWQDMSENENEPSLQTIINSLYGYGTTIASSQQPQYPNNGSQPVYYGEEVASALWNVADATQPVSIRQLAAYHTQYDPPSGTYPATTIGWYNAGSSQNVNILFQDQPGESQSLLPTVYGSTSTPAAATLTPSGAFGWDIDGEFSQDNLNTADLSNGRSGHAVRFYPVRDSAGNLVPNEWLMVMDYENSAYDNSDFQDNIYLVSNMRPQAQAPAPADAQATAAAAGGVNLQWQPVSDGSLVGYNIYRSNSPTGTFTKLNGSPISTARYLDATAPQGVTSYYRITAVDASGESLGANASAVATASNATITTLAPTGDAYVIDGAPNTNFGSATDLQAKVSSAGYNHESYLRFDLSGLSGTLTGATLKLFGELETPGPDYAINVIPVAAGSWSESTVTWNTRPADGSPVLGSMNVSGTTGQWYTVDLTSYIQSQLAAGHTTISLALEGAGPATAGYADFNSREAAANGPQLQLATVPTTTTNPSGTATFVKSDSTTSGNWTGVYGADGYTIFGGATSLPSYASLSVTGAQSYTWANSTGDSRGLQTAAGAATRIAACDVSGTSFTYDLNLTDGKIHQVALYALSWDSWSYRNETITVSDAATGAVLDTRNVSNFGGGQWLVWNFSGHVKITVTNNGGLNAVVSGIFFGPGSAAASATAQFVKTDTTTGGTWTGTYGSSGYSIAGGATTLPSYASLSVTGAQSYTWATSSTDTRDLQTAPGAATRIAACDVSGTNFTFDLNLTDGKTHQVALYALNWDSWSYRNETITIGDATTGAVLDSRTINSFGNGQWLVWDLSGHVTITVSNSGGINAVISGIFFDEIPSSSGPSASFVKTDTSTGGTWTGAYGADGYSVINQATSLPSYAQLAVSGQSNYTWANPATDPRALQDSPGNGNRIAACDYTAGASGSSFTLDLNLTDGKPHQVALYLVDWDSRNRAETVQISDAATGAVLDTRTASNFSNGQWLVWDLSGHVKITITCTAGPNAVASGIFFG